jgi:acyl carrier protein
MPSNHSRYVDQIFKYVKDNYVHSSKTEIPLDKSLVEIGLLDSYAVVELVGFLELNFRISIPDDHITKDNLGSINKMASYVAMRLEDRGARENL